MSKNSAKKALKQLRNWMDNEIKSGKGNWKEKRKQWKKIKG